MFNCFFNNFKVFKNYSKNLHCQILHPNLPTFLSNHLVNNVKNCNIGKKLHFQCQICTLSRVNVKIDNLAGIREIRRYYRPDRNVDWAGIRRKWRVKQILLAKKKHKNHPRVAMRFRLTRFGWERLQSGRNAKKLHLSRQKYKNKKRIKYVSRSDLKKLQRQMPGHQLRIRDPPVNNNPNIRNTRKIINAYFG